VIKLPIGLFKKPYIVRHYEAQVIVNGYASAPFRDSILYLNVQPLTPNELMALPEGERTIKRIKSFGAGRLTSADEFEGIPGDRLFYSGYWYECTSSVFWEHTMLKHYRSDFTILPPPAQMPPPKGEAKQ
jgi:hypothetical protein